MPSRMTPEQLAAAKAAAGNSNTYNAWATAANGHGVSRAAARKAEAALVQAVGSRTAGQLKEAALQRAGAKPKGLRRFFG